MLANSVAPSSSLIQPEIEVPKDFEITAEDDADEDDQLASEDTWNDTGLSIFTEENGNNGQWTPSFADFRELYSYVR